MEGPMKAHRAVNPPKLAPPSGFSYAMEALPGRTIYLAGHVAFDAAGEIAGKTMPAQYTIAAANLVATLREAGAEPHHLVSLQIFVTDVDEYKTSLAQIGLAHQRHFGKHYPATGLFGVSRLYDPAALIELMGVAVVPD